MKITEFFDRGEFVVTAEVGPPKGCHAEGIVEEAKTYLSGITAVNVTDNQSSVMRMGSLATCKLLKDAGLTPIFQMTCRDRNRIALESDLLSAAAFGIENILCLTGDHTKLGDHPGAKPVFDLDSVSLLRRELANLNKDAALGYVFYRNHCERSANALGENEFVRRLVQSHFGADARLRVDRLAETLRVPATLIRSALDASPDYAIEGGDSYRRV